MIHTNAINARTIAGSANKNVNKLNLLKILQMVILLLLIHCLRIVGVEFLILAKIHTATIQEHLPPLWIMLLGPIAAAIKRRFTHGLFDFLTSSLINSNHLPNLAEFNAVKLIKIR